MVCESTPCALDFGGDGNILKAHLIPPKSHSTLSAGSMHNSWILLTSVLLPGLQTHSLTKRQEEGNGQQPEAREVAPGIYSYTTGGAYISMFIVEDEVRNNHSLFLAS